MYFLTDVCSYHRKCRIIILYSAVNSYQNKSFAAAHRWSVIYINTANWIDIKYNQLYIKNISKTFNVNYISFMYGCLSLCKTKHIFSLRRYDFLACLRMTTYVIKHVYIYLIYVMFIGITYSHRY